MRLILAFHLPGAGHTVGHIGGHLSQVSDGGEKWWMTAGNRVLCMKTAGELESTVDFYLLSLGTIGKKRR